MLENDAFQSNTNLMPTSLLSDLKFIIGLVSINLALPLYPKLVGF